MFGKIKIYQRKNMFLYFLGVFGKYTFKANLTYFSQHLFLVFFFAKHALF
jgi:hypothetical protein